MTTAGTQRLTDRQVWTLLEQSLQRLDVHHSATMTAQERRRLARICINCVKELRMRGSQLHLVP